jgi:hypothetical protein
MKKLIVALFVVACAIAGAQLVTVQNLVAGTCPSGGSASNLCRSFDHQTSDGAIGSTSNAATNVGQCRLVCTVGTGTNAACVWAIRRYASVSTGAIVRDHIYPLPPTEAVYVEVNDVFANGAYGDALTGTVTSTCGIIK